MRPAGVLVVLSLVVAASAAAEDRSPALRIFVRTGQGDTNGAAVATVDVQQILRQQKPESDLTSAPSSEAADLVLWVTTRGTRVQPHDRTSEEFFSCVVQGIVVDNHDNRSVPVRGTSVVWRDAAAQLVAAVAGLAREQQHVLLRRRADWPDVGFEFEALTKERKQQFGAKAGGAIVTDVRPQKAAQEAGLRVGDAIVGLDGRKLKSAADLAKAIYTAAPATRLMIDVAQRGSRRTVVLAIP